MGVRTFYWDAATARQPQGWRRVLGRGTGFRVGNAGDLFNLDLLRWAYPGVALDNVADDGRRLLLVGSVAHRILPGDVVCGIGSKKDAVPPAAQAPVRLLGVRGPKTLKLFEEAGHDTTAVRFLGDPGLLIGRIYPEVLRQEAEPGRVIFVPHYRERRQFRPTRRYDVVDIDATVPEIGREIRRAELVYTSSLHGLVFAHALGRPAVLVTPRSDEPAFKYDDYLLSIGERPGSAGSLDEALARPAPLSPPDVSAAIEAISLPDLSELAEYGVSAAYPAASASDREVS